MINFVFMLKKMSLKIWILLAVLVVIIAAIIFYIQYSKTEVNQGAEFSPEVEITDVEAETLTVTEVDVENKEVTLVSEHHTEQESENTGETND